MSSSSTSFTPSILQRSHSVPSSKSPIIKSGTKQSVILTSMSGQSLSRQPDMKPGGAQQPIVTQRGRQQSAASRSNVRQHAQLSQQQMERKTCQISSSRQFPSSPEVMPGTIPVISTGRKASGNIGAVPSIKSTVITARTTSKYQYCTSLELPAWWMFPSPILHSRLFEEEYQFLPPALLSYFHV